jgi:asparagine synthase (glutamine-hydrolysing)
VCGIAGIVTDEARNGAAAPWGETTLRHRGPDGVGEQRWTGPAGGWSLLHTRLAINDLSPLGHQPMTNEDGSLVMVFNGEIYNSPELRRRCEAEGHVFRSSMDGEVILHLWEMHGEAALSQLNGIFAVAVASTVTGDVIAARDPLGVKPLFYAGDTKKLWFASELTALAEMGAPLGEPDVLGLAQFLTFLWIPDPQTPYAGARSLPPGHVLRRTAAGVEVAPYQAPLAPEPDDDLTEKEALAAVGERFGAAADRQLLADVPIGLMASGGVDSGLLWWATKDSLVRAYTIGWSGDGSGEQPDSDVQGVRALQQRFHTPVELVAGEDLEVGVLPPSGDLFADPAYALTRVIASTAREQGIKVLLSGQGGDELFAGYRRHAVAPFVGRFRAGPAGALVAEIASRASGRVGVEYLARIAQACGERDPFRAYMRLCTYSRAVDRARALDCTEQEVGDDRVWQRHREVYESLPEDLSFLRKAMTLDLLVYMPGLGLSYVDRAGMEFGVEIRVPWLDLDMVRWSLTLPDRLLTRGHRTKWLTRELAARAISREYAGRPKRGFGAPVSAFAGDEAAAHGDGFRQSRYLRFAVDLLQRHRERELPRPTRR